VIIDIHGHLGHINLAPAWSADAARLEAWAEANGVDRLCVTSARSLMYDVAEGNRELVAALASTKRLLGWVTVNPVVPATLGELEALGRDKIIGVKVHPDYHGYDLDSLRARTFLDAAAARTRLMLFHVSCMPGKSFARAESVLRFAARHPRTNIIMAHMAGIWQDGAYPYFPNFEGLEKVREAGLPNVWVDTAHYLSYVYPEVMARMVELIGAARIVFGTDMPLQGPQQVSFLLQTIRALPIAEAERDAILGGNAQALIER